MKKCYLITVAVILFLAGCGHPYSTKKNRITNLFEERQKNILNSNQLSQQTQQFLRLKNLTKEYRQGHIELIEEIYDEVLKTEDLNTIRTLAELCIQEGRRRRHRNNEDAMALYLTAAEASYSNGTVSNLSVCG